MSHFKFEHPAFVTTAMNRSHYPSLGYPEIAVAGRSNVGKSSLLNYLFKRKGLVKTSSTPGKTQAVNFFTVDDSLSVVDLPGYGYAKVSKKVRSGWGKMIEEYLETRENLHLVLYLFDIRRTPNEEDRRLVEWFAAREKMVLLVLTKVDKVSKTACKKNTQHILEAFGFEDLHHVHTSAAKKVGRDQVIQLLNEALTSEGIR